MTSARRRVLGSWIPILLVTLLVGACGPGQRPEGSSASAPAAPGGSSAAVSASTAATGEAAPAGFDERAVASFYRGKTIRILVGTAAGGSYDLVSRSIARYLGRFVPSQPTVIVENMPGANNLVAANNMYRMGPKDGTLIQAYVGSLIVRQLFGAPGVEYDASKLQYIGAPATDAYIFVTNRKAAISRIEDSFGPQGKALAVGTLGPGSPLEIGPALLRDVFSANLRLVSGYDGGAKIRLALEGGEIDAMFTSWQEVRGTSRDKLDSGEWQILSVASADPLAELPGVPSLLDLARDDEQRQLFRFATVVPYQFARPYVLVPEVPIDRVRALEQAFSRTMQDPEFLAEAERSALMIEPVGAARVRQWVLEFLNMPPALRERLQPIMLPV